MKKIIGALAMFAISGFAHAVPSLQLDIVSSNTYYDSADQNISTSSTSFSLYAYGKTSKTDTLHDYFVSIAITPKAVTGTDIGSFVVDGVTYTGADMFYGVPPLDDPQGITYDAGDLPPHGIFPTLFIEKSFNFTDAQKRPTVDTALVTGSDPLTNSGSGLFYFGFDIDITNLSQDYELHFDLYDECAKLKKGVIVDIDICRGGFAPFSHDAETARVPEPSTFMLLGLSLLGFGLIRIKKSKNN